MLDGPGGWQGAEWWGQVYTPGAGLRFHFDKDEAAMAATGLMRNPVWSSVLYLNPESDCNPQPGPAGGPPPRLGATLVMNQTFDPAAAAAAPEPFRQAALVRRRPAPGQSPCRRAARRAPGARWLRTAAAGVAAAQHILPVRRPPRARSAGVRFPGRAQDAPGQLVGRPPVRRGARGGGYLRGQLLPVRRAAARAAARRPGAGGGSPADAVTAAHGARAWRGHPTPAACREACSADADNPPLREWTQHPLATGRCTAQTARCPRTARRTARTPR